MPSKPKWEITKITISQNTKRTYLKPNEQLTPERWPTSYLNLNTCNYHLDTKKVKTAQKLKPKQANTENQIRTSLSARMTVQYKIQDMGE